MNTFSTKIEKSDFEKVKSFFEELNAEFSTQQYAVFRATTTQGAAVLYTSGKLLIQGKDVSKLAQKFSESMGTPPIASQKSIEQLKAFDTTETQSIFANKPHIGVDESGKGDFFGPLVIAGVLADEENTKKFIEAGIKDSKKLTDEKILKLAGIIKANATHSVVTIGNERYNELYAKFQNLNKLLAWGHARVIENILEKKDCKFALSDKFGNESLIKNALLEKGRTITLEQRVRGEEDIAVAAASVLARAEYVNRMQTLSNRYELELPKGASDRVLAQAKEFSKKWGKEKLSAVAKMHFKTAAQV